MQAPCDGCRRPCNATDGDGTSAERHPDDDAHRGQHENIYGYEDYLANGGKTVFFRSGVDDVFSAMNLKQNKQQKMFF